MSGVFDTLNAINVNDRTEKKKTGSTELTYLSWTWAWAEVKKRYPDAHYEIVMHDGLPYVYDENTGYMVFTNVTIEGITHMMWLPVMDGANKAMKNAPYEYSTKYGKKSVESASMFDINKTIMRCLVKNLAMFGLGLYIYAGEDLPEVEAEEQKGSIEASREVGAKKVAKIEGVELEALKAILDGNGIKEETILSLYNVRSLDEITYMKYENIQKNIDKIKAKQED